jgi:3-isopropylmalate/(R)-2-methylmalate dehydratase small subunit
VTNIEGTGLPLMRDYVDTDIIAPATELLVVTSQGLADIAFKNWRVDDDGTALDTVFNDRRYLESTVLLAGEMFGCGSSREHAVWALKAFGIRVIAARSFGEIFQRNAARNGIVPVVVSDATLQALAERTRVSVPPPITFHLDAQTGRVGDLEFSFELTAETVRFVVDGYDEIDATMKLLGLTDECTMPC